MVPAVSDGLRGTIRIQRTLSETPLNNLHQRGQAGRKRRPIPWASFERSRYDERCLRLAQDQAQRLAEGEYGAVGLFGEIVSGLAMTGAPFDVVSAASTVSSDEIRHADYCVQFAELCAGQALTLGVDRDAVDEACEKLDSTEEVDFFFGKIDGGLDPHAQLEHALREFVHERGKFALQRAQRRARSLLRAAVDEVGDGLGLR